MADALTERDRTLIDAAVSSGKITRVPVGISGIDYALPVTWRGKGASIGASIAKRRAKVRELALEGFTIGQIAMHLGVKTETVRYDLASRIGVDTQGDA